VPLCADPDETIPFSLKTDEAKPADARPVFHLRFLTEREARKVRRLIKQANAETDDDQADALLSEAIAVGLDGLTDVKLRGKDVKHGDPPSSYLTTAELWELVYAVLNKPALTEDERGKSASSPASTAGPTAPTAGGASA
jgi:hypothetical protein